MTERQRLLALDTATRTAVLALGDRAGSVLDSRAWVVGHGHAETLLPGLDELLATTGTDLADIAAVICGTGPGSFTGMRVGLATGKILAYALGVPIVGVPSHLAMARSAATRAAGARAYRVIAPAGPTDRYVTLVPALGDAAGDDIETVMVTPATPLGAEQEGVTTVAVDLAGDSAIPPEAQELGEVAMAGLGAALLALGAAALTAGRTDSVEELVPRYVTLPRGVREAAGSVEWSGSRP